MLIQVSIRTHSTVATADFYPNENVMWIKTGGVCVRKNLTPDESMLACQLLMENPVGKFINMVTEKVEGYIKDNDIIHRGQGSHEHIGATKKLLGGCNGKV